MDNRQKEREKGENMGGKRKGRHRKKKERNQPTLSGLVCL